MTGQEIAPDEWLPFFDAFSSLHRGSPFTLEIVKDGESAVVAYEVPLEDIAPTPDDPRAIGIVLRGDPDEDVRHVVHDAARVELKEDAHEREGTLEIASSQGRVRLSYRHVPLPEPDGDLLA